MTTIPPARDWDQIDWPQAANGDPASWIAVLPLGATEQHGHHLPLGTDNFIAQAYLQRVRELLPTQSPAIFLPPQTIGLSVEHVAFPGTLTLPSDVALKSWRAIGDSVARAGVKKLVMITSHGGNSSAMDVTAVDLRLAHDMLVATTSWLRLGQPPGLFDDDEWRHGIHGGAVETSIMLAFRPDLVRMDKLRDNQTLTRELEKKNQLLRMSRPAALAWAAQDLNASGAMGDATKASAEKGKALIDFGAKQFLKLIEEMAAFGRLRDPKDIAYK
jgi:creatinine amidohydrolase